MNRKGFTLIEVIVSIAIIGILSVSFLPLITFSYNSIVRSKEFTQAMLDDQELVEEQIDALRFQDPSGDDVITMFGVNVAVHAISMNTTASGLINVYMPKQTLVPEIPVIQSDPLIVVKNEENLTVFPTPGFIDLLEEDYLFVDEVTITPETSDDHLMNVYRWYTSIEMAESSPPTIDTDEVVIVHEWNEAKTVVPLEEAEEKGFIPNFKEYTTESEGTVTYNKLNYTAIGNYLDLTDEELINKYGNRYVYYGVTPYSIVGRMGVERFSQPVYIRAPKLEIESAVFDEEMNAIVVKFTLAIKNVFLPQLIQLNEDFPEFSYLAVDSENDNELIIGFEADLDLTGPVEGNRIEKGAVSSSAYGAITIWSNDEPAGVFTVTVP